MTLVGFVQHTIGVIVSEANIKGCIQQLHHFCAACLINNRVRLRHTENSSDCPLRRRLYTIKVSQLNYSTDQKFGMDPDLESINIGALVSTEKPMKGGVPIAALDTDHEGGPTQRMWGKVFSEDQTHSVCERM